MGGQMTIRSQQRGWSIIFTRDQWLYADINESIKQERPCRHCGKWPTINGHDACLGKIAGIVSACCGHGIEEPYTQGESDEVITD